MDWDHIDWPALDRLRTAFLDGTAGTRDYWRSERDLASYDDTFAQRIGWKWDYVLSELTRRGWSPPAGEVVDWGCGTGVAGRAAVEHWGLQPVERLILWDRSPLAMQYTATKARARFPGLNTWIDRPPDREFATLLISHVLTELTDVQLEELVLLAYRATAIAWVEPGTYEVSRKLIAIRERLRGQFHVVAPCTHAAPCGLLLPGNSRHWCHHFAPSPPEVFTDGNWARFANLTGIDLRSLPVSFLVLDQRPPRPLPTGAGRMLGAPRVYKAHAQFLGCDETGVRERRVAKRALPQSYRSLKRGETGALLVWEEAGPEVVRLDPV